jgi:hypothetical protein
VGSHGKVWFLNLRLGFLKSKILSFFKGLGLRFLGFGFIV